ncbi:MAG: molybdenum cofactor guanylyltransferase [Bacteroidales bacterium]|nr:molybdenum cofactor guanylyltransferase [Bacteroidales bacterium]
MSIFSHITLAILAGGKASRIGGRNKALLEIDGITFIQRIHQTLSPVFSKIIVISNDIIDFGIDSIVVYPDIIMGIGPLGGIHSALVNSTDSAIFVVSCDMPFVDSKIAANMSSEFLKNKPDILVPLIGSHKEPLFALYSKSLIRQIELMVNSTDGRSVTDLFPISKTLFYNISENLEVKKCFTNINSFDDFKDLSFHL